MAYVEKSAIIHEAFKYDGTISGSPSWVEDFFKKGELCSDNKLGLIIKSKNKRGLRFLSVVRKGDYLCKTSEGIISIEGDCFEKNYVSVEVLNECI